MTRRWTTAGVVGAVLASLLAVTTGSAQAAAVPDLWPSETGGPGNARMNAGETALTAAAAAHVELGWSRADATAQNGAPTVVGNIGYEVVNAAGANVASQFQAFNVRNGRTLWTVDLPRGGKYPRGVTVTGHVAVMSYDGVGAKPGGVTAVGLTNQHVVWSVAQTAGAAGTDRTVSGQVVSDGSFVYLLSAAGVLSSLRLADGVRQWRTLITGRVPDGIALGNKILFTGGANGLVAYDTVTGKKSWTAPGVGAPVVAGGRVVTAADRQVVGVGASGCGAATCTALWTTTLPYPKASDTRIGGLDGTYLYVTYTDSGRNTGGLVRLGAISGRVIWKAPIAGGGAAPVRGASTVWTVAGGDTLLGFAADATATKPLVSVTEAAAQQGDDQELALAGGRVFVRSSPTALAAYAPPAA